MSELQRALAAAAEALAAEKTARRDESAAAAAEIAQLTEQLTAAEAARRSGMSDISWEDVQPDLERGETPSPLVRGAGSRVHELLWPGMVGDGGDERGGSGAARDRDRV